MKSLCLAGLLLAVFAGANLAQSASPDLAIAFRYDKNRVISHVADMEDPVKITNVESSNEPVTRDSNCGYQIPLTALRDTSQRRCPNPRSIPSALESLSGEPGHFGGRLETSQDLTTV